MSQSLVRMAKYSGLGSATPAGWPVAGGAGAVRRWELDTC
jgi:hypothetical protein